MMSGGFKILKCLSLVLMLVGYSSCQLPDFPDDPRNFDICTMSPANFPVNAGESYSDNFGCLVNGVLTCFQESDLCNTNGAEFCTNGEDEGGDALNSLECDRTNQAASTFVCNPGNSISMSQLCDGVNDCEVGNNPATGGDDETAAICANKCLAPYGGGCTRLNRLCINSAFDVNCGECLDGFVENAQFECVLEELVFELAVPSSVTEGTDDDIQICVELTSGEVVNQQLVTISLGGGGSTAVDGEDYDSSGASSGLTLVFPAGATAGTQQCTNVPLLDDEVVEESETLLVTAGPNTLTFIGGNQAFVNIIDDDQIIYQFSQASYQGVEGGSLTPVVQQISGISSFPISVEVITNNVAGANAASLTDYEQLFDNQEVLVFPAGSGPGASQPISNSVSLVDDSFVEGTESFQFVGSVLTPNAALFTPTTALGIILDNDVCQVQFAQSVYDAGIEGSSQVVCLVKANNAILQNNVMVDVQTIAATGVGIKTAGDDYVPLAEQVVFGPGLASTQCVTLQTINDNIDEQPDEECVTLTATPSAGDAGQIQVIGGPTQVCCLDDDGHTFEFVDLVVTVTEGGVQAQCCIELVEGPISQAGGILIEVEPIPSIIPSAEIGVGLDVDPGVEILFFPAGTDPGTPQATQCFQTDVLNDNQVEDTESYRLSASFQDPNPFDVFTPGRNIKTVNIEEDPLDTVSICLEPPSTDTVPEDVGLHQECVQITGLPDRLEKSVSLTLSTSNGPSAQTDAQDPMDYSGIDQFITFNPFNQNDPQCVNIPIIDDQLCEFDESFTVNLISDDDCVTINQFLCTGTVIIQDNDVATIQSTENSYSVMEGETVHIDIELIGQKGPGRECVVTVTTMDGTALSTVAWRDYFALPPTTFTFDSSNTLDSVYINVCDDSKCEGDEEFEVILMTNSDDCEVANSPIPVTIIDDEVDTHGLGDDPHFSIALPSGELLCYTVQGEHGFSFNLISNQKMAMNAKFVPDARRQEVTWLGSIGIIVQNTNYMGSNETKLRFDVDTKSIYIGDKVQLEARNIEKLTFSNGKLTISEAPPKEGFHYPSVYVDLEDVQLQFTIKYTNQHLDIYWHSTGGRLSNSHGLIGQFFRKGVEIDEIRKILIMPNKEPVPVMRRPVWSFMEREMPDEQLCWTAMNPGYQGEGLIDGTYFDYLVDDVLSTDFKFEEQ